MSERTYDTVSYELADITTRFIAAIIDGLILAIVTGLLVGAGRNAGAGGFSFIIGLGYYWYFWTRREGQTPGKSAMNLRVVKVDGTPIGDMDAFMRYIGYYLNSAIFGLGWIWALFDENHQGWHDKMAKTYVVKAEKRKNYDL